MGGEIMDIKKIQSIKTEAEGLIAEIIKRTEENTGCDCTDISLYEKFSIYDDEETVGGCDVAMTLCIPFEEKKK